MVIIIEILVNSLADQAEYNVDSHPVLKHRF